MGRNALISNRTASRCVGVGTFSMGNSVNGGDDCIAIGYEALLNNAGNNNVAIGTSAGRTCVSGQNVYIGEQAALSNQDGADNVMIGRHAGRNSTGDRNIFIGRMAGRDFVGRSNTLVIHNTSSSVPFLEGSMGENSAWWLKSRGDLLPHSDGAWAIGSDTHRWKEVWALDGTINVSDARLKKDVEDEDLGMEFIESLRPVVWKWKSDSDGEDRRGFIAQEVQQAAARCGSSRKFSAVVDRGESLGLREREFLGPVVKALQELSARVSRLEESVPAGI